jgi:predicted O-methyltransferase YrrM
VVPPLITTRDRRLIPIVHATARPRCPWDARIESERAALTSRTHELIEPGGRSIGEHARITSVPVRWGRFLYSLTRAMRPDSVVEMGTSVGVSGSYIAAALQDNGNGRLITLEGNAVAAAAARGTFESLGLAQRVDTRTGAFTETLGPALLDAAPVELMFIDGHHQEDPTLAYFEQVLPHLAPGAILVFDDVEWSDGMRRAWSRVTQHEATGFGLSLHKLAVWGGRS